jgi:hypothetical protein
MRRNRTANKQVAGKKQAETGVLVRLRDFT